MPTKGVIKVDNELYCVDLKVMLLDPNCPKEYILAVRKWLEETLESERRKES